MSWLDCSTVISFPAWLFKALLGHLVVNFIHWVGNFHCSTLRTSHKYSSLLRGRMLIHQTPWCHSGLPCAVIICFGTADLQAAGRHALIFPSDSIEQGKHINYSSLGTAFIYPAKNEMFMSHTFLKIMLCCCSHLSCLEKGQRWKLIQPGLLRVERRSFTKENFISHSPSVPQPAGATLVIISAVFPCVHGQMQAPRSSAWCRSWSHELPPPWPGEDEDVDKILFIYLTIICSTTSNTTEDDSVKVSELCMLWGRQGEVLHRQFYAHLPSFYSHNAAALLDTGKLRNS